MIERLFVVGLAIGAGNPALAGAWETFEMTCLAPMEVKQDPDTEKLALEDTSEGAEGQPEMAVYRDREGRLLTVMRQDSSTICGIRAPAEEAGTIALAATRWLERAFASGRYTTVGPFKVQSTDWRDPPLFVEYNATWGDRATTLTVGE